MTALFDLNPAGVAIPLGTWPTANEALDLQTPDRGGQPPLDVEGVVVPDVTVRTDALAGGQFPPPPASAPRVLGLDLSLTGTGVASDGWAHTIRYPARKKREDPIDYAHSRLAYIRGTLADRYLAGVDLAVIEGLALNLHSTAADRLAGLQWMVRHMLWRRGIPYAIVSPTSLKLYAVGKGRRTAKQIAADDIDGKAVKDPTLEAVRSWFGWFDGDDNAADASVLFAMGRDHYGAPVVDLPDGQRNALAGVTWPELTHA